MKKTLSVLISLSLFSICLFADVPRTMNYQGKLTNPDGVAVSGPIEITFRIYNSETGGASLWEEDHTGGEAIDVTNGLFDVVLGDLVALDLAFDEEYWVELEIEGEILAPRERLSSVAYSQRAVYADTAIYVIGGSGSDNDWIRVGNIVHSYNTTDTVGVGTTSPKGGRFVVLDNSEGTGIHIEAEPPTADNTVRNSPKLSFTDSYRWLGTPGTHTSSIYTSSPCPGCNRLLNFDNGLTKMTMNSSAVEFEFKGDFQNWSNLDMIFIAPRVTSGYGDGTDVVLDMRGQYWNGSASTERSAKITHEVENDGTSSMNFKIQGDATRMTILSSGNVGVGTTTPQRKFEVMADGTYTGAGGGQIRISGLTDERKRLEIGFNTVDDVGFIQSYQNTGTVKPLILNPNTGNVGIATNTPTRTLDVNGDARITGNLGVDTNLGVTGQTTTGTFRMATGAVNGYVLTSDASGNGTWQLSGGGGGIGGSGTNGRIARFTPDGATLGNSTFRDDGTTVGLNAAQNSANMLYIQDDRAISAKQGLFVDSYTSNTGTGDIIGLLAKARVTASGNHNAAGIIGMVDGNNMNWAVGVMAVNKSGSTTPVVPSVLTALYADGSNNWAWSGWFTGGHVAISRATAAQTGELHFHDLDGTALANYVGFKAPTALSSNYVYTLPSSYPASSGQVLSSTTAGVLSWTAASGSGWNLTGNAGTTPGTNFVGTTDGQALVFKTNNNERVRITSGGDMAIGNFTNPEAMLEIRETIADIYVRAYNDYSWQDGGRLALQRMGGSQTSPTATLANYGLGALDFRGGYGSTVSGVTAASIKSVSPVTWVNGSSTRGGDLRFYTINVVGGANIYDYERMRIGSQGGVGININPTPSTSTNYDPTAYMHVYGGIGIGPVNNSISLAHGQENSIQIASDTYYGGTNDNHSGYLIYSIMPGGWGTGELGFACATDWGVYNTTTPALRITQTGIYVNGTYYGSDRRIKSDFRDMPYGLQDVLAMKPLLYSKHIAEDMSNGKPHLGNGFEEIGFIAQDLYEILPEVVSKPSDENSELWGIDYAKIVPVLVQAIKEQQSKIEQLEEKLELYKELEKRIEILEINK
jgi:hypothetical protein